MVWLTLSLRTVVLMFVHLDAHVTFVLVVAELAALLQQLALTPEGRGGTDLAELALLALRTVELVRRRLNSLFDAAVALADIHAVLAADALQVDHTHACDGRRPRSVRLAERHLL